MVIGTLLSSCGGGSHTGADDLRPSAHSSEAGTQARRAQAREALLMRQDAACDRVGDRLFACAVQDGQASMDEEAFAELEVSKLKAQYKRDFQASCMRSALSLRQVQIYEGCTAQDGGCDTLLSCLDKAQPQPQDSHHQQVP